MWTKKTPNTNTFYAATFTQEVNYDKLIVMLLKNKIYQTELFSAKKRNIFS